MRLRSTRRTFRFEADLESANARGNSNAFNLLCGLMEHRNMHSSRSHPVPKDITEAAPLGNGGLIDRCVICLEEVSQVGVAIPCRHRSFDFICIANWLQERSACPLCKREVRSVEYDRKSSTEVSIYAVESAPPAPSTASPRRGNAHSTTTFLRPHRPRPPRLSPTPNTALQRRKHVYQHQQYSLHIGSNPHSRYREFTPASFAHSPDLISRAKTWIRRELRVFDFLASTSPASDGDGHSNGSQRRSHARPDRRAANAEFLLEYIVAILKTVDTRGSGGQAEEMLQEFLGRDDARLFLHELRQWLRSPYLSLEAWDRHTQYPDEAGRWNEQRRACRRLERECVMAEMAEVAELVEDEMEDVEDQEKRKKRKEEWLGQRRKRSSAAIYHGEVPRDDTGQRETTGKRQRQFSPT